MATKYHNLSDYDADALPSADILSRQRYAIVVADWNSNVTFPMCQGAIDTLVQHGVPMDNIVVKHVPGTFELTYAAKTLQRQESPHAIIVIGCVVQGDTPHFDYVCQGVTIGVAKLNSEGVCPVIFSVLTTLTMEQAEERAGGRLGNKGVEGAVTAIKMANLFA